MNTGRPQQLRFPVDKVKDAAVAKPKKGNTALAQRVLESSRQRLLRNDENNVRCSLGTTFRTNSPSTRHGDEQTRRLPLR